MTTALSEAPIPTYSDQQIITMLVASHGDFNLAAERLRIEPRTLIDRLPSLPYETLASAIKNARLLNAFDKYTVMQDVVFQTLEELTPDRRAKFLIEFMDRFEVMVNPPVHGGSGQPSSHNVTLNLNSPEAQNDARAELGERLIHIQSRPARDLRDVQEPTTHGPSQPASEFDTRSGDDAPVRLGTDGQARTIRAIRALDDMAPVDGSGIREDANGSANHA